MIVWTVRLCLAAFICWTASMPGEECYIAPHIWVMLLLWYRYAMGSGDIFLNIFHK